MFPKAFVLLTLPLFAAAGAVPSKNTCNSGTLACCNQHHAANSPDLLTAAGLLGLPLSLAKHNSASVQCSPISVIGAGFAKCNQQTVCCDNNTYSNVLINFGCSPINIGS